MAVTITEQLRDNAASRKSIVIVGTFVIGPGETDYFTPDLSKYDFAGFASMQIILTGATGATLTAQIEVNNTLSESNWVVPYDIYGVIHPALCTAQAFSTTPNKAFENIVIPSASRVRWKLTEAGGSAALAGAMYLNVLRGN